jgi:hypothetical protein
VYVGYEVWVFASRERVYATIDTGFTASGITAKLRIQMHFSERTFSP